MECTVYIPYVKRREKLFYRHKGVRNNIITGFDYLMVGTERVMISKRMRSTQMRRTKKHVKLCLSTTFRM